jgi:integral membrane sensor domain MASE1
MTVFIVGIVIGFIFMVLLFRAFEFSTFEALLIGFGVGFLVLLITTIINARSGG